MDKVKDLLTSGKGHTTTVDSNIQPEVVHETVKPIEQIETVKNVVEERDIHHHQHRILPVVDRAQAETKHESVNLGTEHRHHEQKMADADRARLQQMHHAVKDEQVVAPTERHVTEIGGATKELVNHHIHETIQPVIEREVVAPTVVHQQATVHHHIHEKPVVHDQTVEPTLSMSEFQSKFGNVGAPTHSVHHDMKPNVVPTESHRERVSEHTGNTSSGTATGEGVGR